jgi:hypothetical protein
VLAVLMLLTAYFLRHAVRSSTYVDHGFSTLQASNQALEAANHALEASEERFRAVAEAASDWIWEVDRHTCADPYLSARFSEVTATRKASEPARALGDWCPRITRWSRAEEKLTEDSNAGDLRCTCRDRRRAATPLSTVGAANYREAHRGRLLVAPPATSPTKSPPMRRSSTCRCTTPSPARPIATSWRVIWMKRCCSEHAPPLSLLVIDLDNFRRSTTSRPAGDAVLEVASRLRECTREHDIVARLGGDELSWCSMAWTLGRKSTGSVPGWSRACINRCSSSTIRRTSGPASVSP